MAGTTSRRRGGTRTARRSWWVHYLRYIDKYRIYSNIQSLTPRTYSQPHTFRTPPRPSSGTSLGSAAIRTFPSSSRFVRSRSSKNIHSSEPTITVPFLPHTKPNNHGAHTRASSAPTTLWPPLSSGARASSSRITEGDNWIPRFHLSR